MRKSLIASILILGLVGMVVGVAVQGADTAPVTATVTVQNISVAVTDGTVAYGILAAGASKDTLIPVDLQTATNNGNVTATFNIKGTVSSPAGWTLGAAASGSSVYRHAFSRDSFVAENIALTTDYVQLASGVAVDGTETFDLKITTPPSASDFTQQTVNVTVQAII